MSQRLRNDDFVCLKSTTHFLSSDASLYPSIRRVHPELVCGSDNNRKHLSNAEGSKDRSQPGVPKVRQRWMLPLRLPPAVTPRHR